MADVPVSIVKTASSEACSSKKRANICGCKGWMSLSGEPSSFLDFLHFLKFFVYFSTKLLSSFSSINGNIFEAKALISACTPIFTLVLFPIFSSLISTCMVLVL